MEWEKALEHISEHFRQVPHKRSHTIFRKKLRDPEILKDYIKRAASHPSTVRISRLTIDSQPSGMPCALIIREFKEPIGTEDDEVCLFVVVDVEGTLITAFPKTKKDAGLG